MSRFHGIASQSLEAEAQDGSAVRNVKSCVIMGDIAVPDDELQARCFALRLSFRSLSGTRPRYRLRLNCAVKVLWVAPSLNIRGYSTEPVTFCENFCPASSTRICINAQPVSREARAIVMMRLSTRCNFRCPKSRSGWSFIWRLPFPAARFCVGARFAAAYATRPKTRRCGALLWCR